MAKKDYYSLLNVSREANESEIKKAYRRLAMKYHPDRNPDDPTAAEKFKEISEAYEVLANPQKRAAYDQFGHAGVSGQADYSSHGFDFSDVFNDIFENVFGGRHSGRQVNRGRDLLYELEIDLNEAVHGTTREIHVSKAVSCEECQGSGVEKGKHPVTCRTCGGIGQVRMHQGFLSIQQTCPTCRGQGKLILDPCGHCRGEGRVQKRRTLSVKIPAGVDSGDRIRLSGEGEAGMQGALSGDLYVEIRIKEHPIFTREGQDLYCDVPVSFTTMTLGGDIEVPTLQGAVKLRVPPETQSGKVFRLRGKGVTSLHGKGTGDLFCRVMVETPVGLTAQQKELLREFEASLIGDGKEHTPKIKSWFASVKRFFAGDDQAA